jgi:Co/Zn/Cd efflux system component
LKWAGAGLPTIVLLIVGGVVYVWTASQRFINAEFEPRFSKMIDSSVLSHR